ncbi:hypothetical protein JTE90_016759 [Oedothorax gibbosus]|uniref:RING-CH-type domain-containing protein n=1 Tax=Oedothorax gibbosus TaxID=931172 RepID=A0AAV6W016_9ARAC|nr:hypothetical protein JTE90_016759 [Oedothorax gibbosus]
MAFNCASDDLSCKVSTALEDAGNVSLHPADTCHVFAQHVSENKSLYKSKSCKYSFLASDYTSPEGQKLLSIKISQNPIESCNGISKRSISEYFLREEGQRLKAADEAGPSEPLHPNVNFKVFDIESLSEEDRGEAWFLPSASAAQLSIASSAGDLPTCKICHTAAKPEDPLISPCRCTGTLRYIHCGCLMKWLEICNKRSRKPPICELCKYQFHWHKKFKVGQWQFPHCSWQDKILHTIFLISVLIMIGCAIVTVLCFKQHRVAKAEHLELTQSEIVTLVCGALFFLAFFLAMYVEIKARNTIYKLLLKFIYLNQQWYIDEYDKKKETSVIDV